MNLKFLAQNLLMVFATDHYRSNLELEHNLKNTLECNFKFVGVEPTSSDSLEWAFDVQYKKFAKK